MRKFYEKIKGKIYENFRKHLRKFSEKFDNTETKSLWKHEGKILKHFRKILRKYKERF